ncbi:uncharacterized protein [Amphiura filiformis]|uniref:uncharacterized protein n=1 Tax=Amphiura filiformis TaxID=82378 RepID=UPI003B21EDFE
MIMIEYIVLSVLLIFDFQCGGIASNSSGSGTRFSVRIEEVINGSYIEIGVQQSDDDRDSDNVCPPGQYLSDDRRQLRSKFRTRRDRYDSNGLKHINGQGSTISRMKRSNKCRHCSVCSEEQVVLSSCTATENTQCGICIDIGKNTTCQNVNRLFPQDIPIFSVEDQTSLYPSRLSKAFEEADNGIQTRVTTSSNLLAESEGDSSDFIGALATAALSLVMLVILMVTGPLVIYLKVRDWCRYRRSPQQDIENGHCWHYVGLCCYKQSYETGYETTPCDANISQETQTLRITRNPVQDV